MKRALLSLSLPVIMLCLCVLPAMAEIPGRLEPKDMAELLMMTRREVLLTFGEGYVPKDGEGWQRYYYPSLGYTFVFEASADDFTPLRLIDVDDGIPFDGFYGGMPWQQVIDLAGDRVLTDRGNPALGEDPALYRRSYTYDCSADGGITALPCFVHVYGEWAEEDAPAKETHVRLISPSVYSPRVFYNPQGGQYYHSGDFCNAVSSRFHPLAAITCYNKDTMDRLKACPYCIGMEDWAGDTRYYSGSDGKGTQALVQKVVDKFTKITVRTPEDSNIQGWRLYIKGELRATAAKSSNGLYTAWFIGNAETEPAILMPIAEGGAEMADRALSLNKGR